MKTRMKCYSLAVACMWSAAAGLAAPYPFSDSFSGGVGNWETNGMWGVWAGDCRSAPLAAADSPSLFYQDNSDSALTLGSPLDLTSAVRPAVRFYQKYSLEQDYDFGYVEVSTNNGASWLPAVAAYSGGQPTWQRIQLALTNVAGQGAVRFRFRLVTDSSITMDGWSIDDVFAGEMPAPVALDPPTNIQHNSLTLQWSAYGGGDFAAYRVYRSQTSNVVVGTARLVAELSGVTATNCTDVTVAPKTRYYYRVQVTSTNNLESDLGNEQSGLTPAGMDYPFLDNAEAGSAVWNASLPWAITNYDGAPSPTHVWTDSPGMDYTNDANKALTLAAPMSFVGAHEPILCYRHRYALLGGDCGYVEISTNVGMSWMTLATYTAADTAWQQARIPLNSYTGAPSVLIQFRLTTDSSGTADGWYVDDMSVSESPEVVNAPGLSEMASFSIRLSWGMFTNLSFSHYAIFRSTTPGVTINSTLVTALYDRATTTFVDTGLNLDTMYYYRVYAVNVYQGISADSPTENAARTLNNPMPFICDFEQPLTNWMVSGTFGRTTEKTHNGSYSFTDSPSSTYPSGLDTWAQTAVDLRGSTWPVLTFHDWSAFADGGDYGYLELSTDGVNYWRPYFISGINTNWTARFIDLTEYRNQANLRIRLRVTTDGGGTHDGWYVDDLSITNRSAAPLAYPFFEDFEHGMTNWFSTTWTIQTNNPYAGNGCAQDTFDFPQPLGGYTFLWSDGEIDLTNAVNPQMVVQMRGFLPYRHSWFRVNVSVNGGLTWDDLGTFNIDTAWDWSWNQPNWERRQASLSGYINQKIRLRMYVGRDWRFNAGEDMVVDNIAVEEMPAAVVLTSAVPSLKSVALEWTQSGLGADFKRYEVYRATHGGVARDDTLILSTTNSATTTLTDTGLSIGATYYYKVYVVNQRDLIVESNERSATTVPKSFPFIDPMENLDNWVTNGTWNATTTIFMQGSASLADSPYGDYANNADNWLMTSVDMRGSTWPVLRFSDRIDFADAGDWGYVEVCTDGSGWRRMCCLTGTNTLWNDRAIDLSEYRNQPNLRIRFRITSDGSGTRDGWQVDNLTLTNHSAPTVELPFLEGFEHGMGSWLTPTWIAQTNGPYAGTMCALDTPNKPMCLGEETFLWLNGEVNLSNAVSPKLVVCLRGYLPPRHSYFRVYISTDHGLSWSELGAFNVNTSWDWPWDQPNWERRETSLAAYAGQTVRLLIYTSRDWHWVDSEDMYVDGIYIGEPDITTPIRHAPQHYGTVETVRPTLVVSNAYNPQDNPLNYEFEVSQDTLFSNVAAQVPGVASGAELTQWKLTIDLANNSQYWWRCRAWDLDTATNGPWMTPAAFYVNESNFPPYMVNIVAPPDETVLPGLHGKLAWDLTTDPDLGDSILYYHIQADTSPSFSSPDLDDANVSVGIVPPDAQWTVYRALSTFSGSSNLHYLTRYYWRIRAQDSRFMYSVWTSGSNTFSLGGPPPIVDVTSTPAVVAYAVSTYAVAGTNNADVTGGMWVSNALTAFVASFPATTAWTAAAAPLEVGSNTLVVSGTNFLGTLAQDSVLIVRLPDPAQAPFVDITSEVSRVAYGQASIAVSGTNNAHVTGDMWWTNVQTGAGASFANCDLQFAISGIPLAVGSNTIVVSGTNLWGVSTNDTTVIVREPASTVAPRIAITSMVVGVAFDVGSVVIAGTNNEFVSGDMWYANAATTQGAGFARSGDAWVAPAIALAPGENALSVFASNQWDAVATGVIAITRFTVPFETFVVSRDPRYEPDTNMFLLRSGVAAPVGLRVQCLVSGTNGEDKFAPPTTNGWDAPVADAAVAQGYMVGGACAEYRVRTTWMGNNNAGTFAGDAGLAGFVSAFISASNSTCEGWLRAFSGTRITNAAYYGDAAMASTALDTPGEVNAACSPRDPVISNINVAYLIPFAEPPAANGITIEGVVDAVAGGSDYQLPAEWLEIEYRLDGEPGWTLLDSTLDTYGGFDGQVVAPTYPTNAQVRMRIKAAFAPQPGLPQGQQVLLTGIVPEPMSLFAMAAFAMLAARHRRSLK